MVEYLKNGKVLNGRSEWTGGMMGEVVYITPLNPIFHYSNILIFLLVSYTEVHR